MRVVVVETAPQAEEAVHRELTAHAVVLALLPEAMAALEAKSVEYVTDSDLVSDARFQEVTGSTLQRARTITAALDSHAGSPLGDGPVWSRLDIEIKHMLDAVLGRARVLADAVKALNATEIIAFA